MEQDLSGVYDTLQKILNEVADLKYGNVDSPPTIGERAADKLVSFIGSWKFLIIQSTCLVLWIGFNLYWLSSMGRFDPYPFILLNLVLSFQAAFASPLILMAQNRVEQKDRRRAVDAYQSIENIEKIMEEVASRLRVLKENGTSHVENKEE